MKRKILILLITILSSLNLIACLGKKTVYVDRVIYKDKIIRVKPKIFEPPKCYFIEEKGFYPVEFTMCKEGYYCLDKKNAISLSINVENLKLCYENLKEWSKEVCQHENIECIGKIKNTDKDEDRKSKEQ